jgi:putative DNA primase/helicase
MLDWRTADLLPHSPEHLSIIQLPVAWNPDATCPAIDAFLSEVLPADSQRFTREAIGYAAVPSAFLRQAVMLMFSANEAPASSDQTDAYFDRWVILPFDRRFEGADVDPHLIDKLTTREELEGLLVQAVSGLMDLAERGRFDLPALVQAAIEEYRAKIDTVATFLEEACELDVRFSVPRSRLYEAYREWCARDGRMAVSQQSFAPRVRTHLRVEIAAGAVQEGSSHAERRIWKGIARQSRQPRHPLLPPFTRTRVEVQNRSALSQLSRQARADHPAEPNGRARRGARCGG